MSLGAHLESLHAKHADIEAALFDAYKHPSSSDIEIHQLKLQKLQLKQEIAELERQRQRSWAA